MRCRGEDIEDIVSATERNGYTPLQHTWICRWGAAEIIDSLHHSNSHASVDKSAKRWLNSPHVSTEFRNVMPDMYKKVLHALEAEFGCKSYLYDRCASCSFLFRCEHQDAEHCPRCHLNGKQSPRWHGQGKSRRAWATMIYNPVAGYVTSLWGRPDMAR